MTNWEVFKIVERGTNAGYKHEPQFIRFILDDYVRYYDGSEKYIFCKNMYPYCDWEENDVIKIDTDETYRCWSQHNFEDASIIKKVSSSNSRVLARVQGENSTLQSRISELERQVSNSESNNNNQLVLRRNAETERNDLQIEKRNLEIRISDLQRDRDSWRSSSWSLQSANSSLQTERDGLKEQVREKNELIRSGERVLQTTQNQLTTIQNQLTRKNSEYDDLTRNFNTLQIESNNKDNEINELKQDLGNSQNIDRRYKERKLDELIRNSGLNRVRVMNLRDAYEKLMKAREDYNLNDITNANTEIETIKQEFFQTNVAIDDLHKIYKTCEKIAELRIKQERLNEQHQAQQEVPPRQ